MKMEIAKVFTSLDENDAIKKYPRKIGKTLSKELVKQDIDSFRNHSWIKEVYLRHKDEMDREVLDYFGNEITYNTLFEESINLARALKASGVYKNQEILLFTDRIPEFVYVVVAANIIGAKVHIASEKFDASHLKKIVEKSKSKVVFIQDNKMDTIYKKIGSALDNKKIISFSHVRSLKDIDTYKVLFDRFYHSEKAPDFNSFINYDKFIESGRSYNGRIYEHSDLNDACTITYSSGSTKKGFPKGIVHCNRHYITMGRYHDPEVSGVPSLKRFKTYSNIPAYSNTYLSSSLTDNLIMGGKVVLDPIDDPNYFLIGMKIHKGNMNVATPSTWIVNALNYYHTNDMYNIKRLPDAMFNFAGGEQLSAGEEKFLNRFFKDLKAGINISHTPFSISKISTAGASCEFGSIFYRLLRGYSNKSLHRIGISEPIGMKVYDFVDIQVLREDGTYCRPYEHGRVVINSDCNMLEYNNNEEETKNFYIKDAYGKIWGNMDVYGYLDDSNNITMKSRINYDTSIPPYKIADEILKDTKKIMSCEVVTLKDNNDYIYVAHILPQYGTSFNKEAVLNNALSRCRKKFGDKIIDILYFKIRDSYPLSSSSKRDTIALKAEGLENCERLVEYQESIKK